MERETSTVQLWEPVSFGQQQPPHWYLPLQGERQQPGAQQERQEIRNVRRLNSERKKKSSFAVIWQAVDWVLFEGLLFLLAPIPIFSRTEIFGPIWITAECSLRATA